MNRQVALHNIRIICPGVSNFLINVYRQPARMIIRGDEHDTEISSLEGTTRVATLASGMLFYALGMTPPVHKLDNLIKTPVSGGFNSSRVFTLTKNLLDTTCAF